MSSTKVVHPILSCLQSIKEYVKAKSDWQTVNDEQKVFLERYNYLEDLDKMQEGELRNKISTICEEVNEWLKTNGFDIALTDADDDPDALYVASILDVNVKWRNKGEITTFIQDKGKFKAIRIKNKLDEILSFNFQSGGDHYRGVHIPTEKDGEYVSLMQGIHKKIVCEHCINDNLREILNSSDIDVKYENIVFPAINYNENIDISFLAGLALDGLNKDDSPRHYWIKQALQQTKFKMNELGAEIQSAAAIGVSGFSDRPSKYVSDFILDEPFTLIINRKDMKQPYFIGYFTEESWVIQ